MTRRMSCSLTVDAVRDRTKTVTRRHTNTWADLKPGDHLTLVEKAMGLRKGERQVVLAEVEIVSNDVIALDDIDHADCIDEGFPTLTPSQFIAMWCVSHGITYDPSQGAPKIDVRRIEWRYSS